MGLVSDLTFHQCNILKLKIYKLLRRILRYFVLLVFKAISCFVYKYIREFSSTCFKTGVFYWTPCSIDRLAFLRSADWSMDTLLRLVSTEAHSTPRGAPIFSPQFPLLLL